MAQQHPFPGLNLDRQAIEHLIDILIEALDASDGDPDSEDADPDTAVDDGPCDDDPDREPEDGVPTLSWPMDQSEPLPFEASTDRRIMAAYRDRIREIHYVKVSSPWRGGLPSWRLANGPARPNFRI